MDKMSLFTSILCFLQRWSKWTTNLRKRIVFWQGETRQRLTSCLLSWLTPGKDGPVVFWQGETRQRQTSCLLSWLKPGKDGSVVFHLGSNLAKTDQLSFILVDTRQRRTSCLLTWLTPGKDGSVVFWKERNQAKADQLSFILVETIERHKEAAKKTPLVVRPLFRYVKNIFPLTSHAFPESKLSNIIWYWMASFIYSKYFSK